jgi:DNA-binding NarL/FixJ family response regulator
MQPAVVDGLAGTRPIRVMIVDDSDEFLRAARTLVESVPGFVPVAEATSGEEAVALYGTVAPDLVLMDIRMDGMGGIEAARRIIGRWPRSTVALVTCEDPGDVPSDALRCGAVRVVQKEELGIATIAELGRLADARRGD